MKAKLSAPGPPEERSAIWWFRWIPTLVLILGRRLSLHPMAVFLGLLIGGKLFGLLGIIVAVLTIAIAKVFLKFLRELYTGSYFYHAGDITSAEAPSEVLGEIWPTLPKACSLNRSAVKVVTNFSRRTRGVTIKSCLSSQVRNSLMLNTLNRTLP
jgi:hypothetical protein